MSHFTTIKTQYATSTPYEQSYPTVIQDEFTQLVERLEPLRELRNHIAHGHMLCRIDPATQEPVVTLFKAKDVDMAYSSEAKHLPFEELRAALTTLTQVIEEFQGCLDSNRRHNTDETRQSRLRVAFAFAKSQHCRNTRRAPPMAKTVQVYNLETKEISTIPVAELAPGMLEADVQGVGRVWIDGSQTREIEGYKHGPFSEEVRETIRTIKAALDEVYPKSIEDWENGFRKDLYPEQEIALWLRISSIYRAFTEDETMPFAERRDIFKVLVTCSISSRDTVFEVLRLDAIAREEAERVVEAYFS